MQLLRDFGVQFYRSKLNRLSTMFTRYDESFRWFTGACRDTVLMQAYRGMVLKQTSISTHNVIVLHDYFPSYDRDIERCERVFCIGNYEYPEFGCNTVRFESFPLDVANLRLLPENRFDAVIGGEIRGDDFDYIMDSLPVNPSRIAIVCSPDGDIGCEETVEMVCNAIRERLAPVELYVNTDASHFLVDTMYLSSRHIVHCGDAMRGYMHALAEYARAAGGRTVVTRNADTGFGLVDFNVFAKKVCEKTPR